MTLKQLEAFYWAARFANFSTAAAKLHMTQSALSKRIGELEVSLGIKLFDRDPYRPRLTEQGRALVEKARQILEMQAEIRESILVNGAVHGECRFGVTELVALTWLPSLVSSVRARHPNATLEPYVDLSGPLNDRLRAGDIDLAVTLMRMVEPGFRSAPLTKVRFSLMVSPRLVAPGPVADLGAFRRLPILAQVSGSALNSVFDEWAHANGFEARRILGSNSLSAIAGMVAAQLGMAFLPTDYYAPLVRQGVLHAADLALEMPRLEYFVNYRPDETNPVARLLRAEMEATCDFSKSSLNPNTAGSPL